MSTLDRRVQVLFDPARYAALEAEAAAQRKSVGAVIREAVEERLGRTRATRLEALERLLASADTTGAPVDWVEEKSSFEREQLRDIP